jgi:hypothetical protein
MTPPVVFLDKLAAARPLNGVGYPYQIKADDLDKNFFAATLIIDEKLVEQVNSSNNHAQRRLRISGGTQAGQLAYWNGSDYVAFSAPPGSGTSVLGAVDGVLTWIATEECP